MADQKITDLTPITGADVADGDLIPIVDVSDATMAASGTNKKITRSELKAALAHASTHASAGADPLTLGVSQVTGAEATANKGAANGYASLGADGKIPSSQVPAIAITDTFTASSQSAMLALSSAEKGDVCVRTDLNKSFILATDSGGGYATLANWQELLTPTDAVLSVNGKTGSVSLVPADLGSTTGSGNIVLATSPSLTTPSLGAASATSLTLTNDLAVSYGGTGAGSFTANGVLYGNGTSPLGVTAAGTSGQALISGGSGAAPAYGTVCDVKYYPADGVVGSNTWTKPANAKAVYVLLMGGGGAGGSGEKIATVTATNGGGGGGGQGGGMSYAWYEASALNATETVVVGAGGTGGGTTTTVGPGADGNAGNPSTFTVKGTVQLYAGGGAPGAGGGTYAGPGGATAAGLGGAGGYTSFPNSMYMGGSGGAGGDGASAVAAFVGERGSAPGSPSGGGGGGGTTANLGKVAAAGGATAYGTGTTGAGIAGGAAATAGGATGGTVTALGNVSYGNGGGGGGGGRAQAGSGGTGGAGGIPGGGGGGGGNGVGASGTNSNGNGGAGGRGFALVVTFR